MAQPIKRFNMAVAVDSFEQNGEKKYKWNTIGEGAEWEDGSVSFTIYTMPLKDGKVEGKMFPKDKSSKQQDDPSARDANIASKDLDLPF